MSEVRSALVWERGDVSWSPITVTLQEAEVRKKHILLAIVCEGDGKEKPQLAAGYLCESMVGWFYNRLLPHCMKKPECPSYELEQLLREQWERALREWQEYSEKYGREDRIHICGILIKGSSYVAWGNRPVYVFNRRFNKPRRKSILPAAEDVAYTSGEIGSFLSFYIESAGMQEGLTEQEILGSLYLEGMTEEEKLQRRLGELGRAAVERLEEKGVGAVILEVQP